MNKSIIYIVGATVLGGGAYLFLKNKKAKDLAELDKLGGATTGGTTPSGTTSGGTTPSGTTPSGVTPNLSEPVKVEKDLNLDNYNLQKTLEEFKKLDEDLKNVPKKGNDTYSNWTENQSRLDPLNKQYWLWYDNVKQLYSLNKLMLTNRLAKLGYKFDNGLLIKI